MAVQPFTWDQLRRILCKMRSQLKSLQHQQGDILSRPLSFPFQSGNGTTYALITSTLPATSTAQIIPARPNRIYLNIPLSNFSGTVTVAPSGLDPANHLFFQNSSSTAIELWSYRNPAMVTGAWDANTANATPTPVYAFEEYRTG